MIPFSSKVKNTIKWIIIVTDTTIILEINNEDFDKNLILIEVGGQYNNIIEVSNTLEIFAKILSLYINEDSNEKT